MDKKELYRKFCQQESIPIFLNDWWLDVVAEGYKWDVLIHKSGDKVVGVFPYVLKKRMGLKLITMPKLTPYLGPWIKYPGGQKYSSRLAYEKDVYTDLIEMLPKFDYYKQRFHHTFTNWASFYWKGFRQTTRYTYILEDLDNRDWLWENLQPKIRTDIKKAKDRFKLEIRDDISYDELISLNENTFKRQGQPLPYSRTFLENVFSSCTKHKSGKAFYAVDPSKKVHAAVYVVWDDLTVYYLMGGSDSELRNSGASSYLVWHAIQFAASESKAFDFEGSMIEPVERFFRAFGGRLVPYFTIFKINSKLLRLFNAFKGNLEV
ncbi:MAG: GNAT family N-acetyltransferase [Candidatus Aminicenantes bacterium]|nr:GNAT family N-acetyltransferase [Candidatus Aminicenantes bacterium]